MNFPQIYINSGIKSVSDQGELVLLNLSSGKFYGLDSIGSEIWIMLQNNNSIERIVKEICEKYEVNQEQAIKDVMQLIEGLKNNELVSYAGV